MTSPFDPSAFKVRQSRLRAQLEVHHFSFLVVTKPVNIFYLTGFRGSAGAAVFGLTDGILRVDPRYTLQARSDARGVEVLETRTSILKAVGQWLQKRKFKRVGYEEAHLTCADLDLLGREAGVRGVWPRQEASSRN